MNGESGDEIFPPTGGRLLGFLALAVGLIVAVLGVVQGDGVSLVTVALGLIFAALAWTVLLRPRVSIEGDDLVLRNMVDTLRVPLAAIEEVVVRQVLALRVGERRYTSTAVSRSRRELGKRDLRPERPDPEGTVVLGGGEAFGLYVQERIRERAREARDALGIRLGSPEQDALAAQVRRTPAVPEIVWLVGSLVLLVVAIVL